MRHCCKECGFYDGGHGGTGGCHRYAPRPGEQAETWPVVTDSTWCGEFEVDFAARSRVAGSDLD